MHIGFLTPEYVLPGRLDGGLANYIHKVAHALTLHGHKVVVFVLSHQDRVWNDGQVKIIEVKSVQSPRFHLPGLAGKLSTTLLPTFDQLRSTRRLAKYVWKQNYIEPIDILQTSSFMAPGYVLRKNGRIPIVCRISSYTPVVRSAFGRQCSLAEYINDWLEIRQVIDSDAAFAPSQFCISLFEQLVAYKPKLIRTPVDIVKTEPDGSLFEKELSGIRYFLFFGTLSKVKGVDLLAEVIPAIIKLYPETHFVFVGRDDGMPDGSKMMDLVLNNNKDHAKLIHYLPAIPKAQLYAIIAHATAVLMPSRVDNYPNACLEAQMLGVPVIGTLNSSLDEMVVDGNTGFLSKNGDIESLKDAIIRLLKLGKLDYQNMKKANLEAFEEIKQENRLEKLLEFYSQVINEFKTRKGS